MNSETTQIWIRNHIVASLLIVAGLGAVGQYAMGRLAAPAMSLEEREATGRRTRRGGQIASLAILASREGRSEEADALILSLESAVAGVDPDLAPLMRETATRLRQWRAYALSPETTPLPAGLNDLAARLSDAIDRMAVKYPDAYR